MAETAKAHNRRVQEGFYNKYIQFNGIDVGCGRIDTFDGIDPISTDAVLHDKDICDATTMEVYPDNTFHYVYASHILEHLADPVTAIKNWLRICDEGGFVIISIPHRDLYERRKTLPSKWNADHKYFYLPDKAEKPHTLNLTEILHMATNIPFEIRVIDTVTNKDKPLEHAEGEYSIEAIIFKPIRNDRATIYADTTDGQQ